MNLAEQLAVLLDSLGIVDYQPTASGGDCFVDRIPDQPDRLIAIFNTAGPPGDIKDAYSSPGAQLRCRAAGTDRRTAKTLADSVWSALHGLGDTTLPDGTWLVSCQADSTPAPIGLDDSGRHEFTVNVVCEVQLLTAHRT